MFERRRHPVAALAIAVTLIALTTTSLSAATRRRAVKQPTPAFNAAFTEGGYANKTSVMQGSSITLHIATSVSPFRLTIVNLANPSVPVRIIDGVTSQAQNCSGRFASGCGWAATRIIDIPTSWPSGYYAASLPTSFGERWVPFVVRSANPGQRTSTLVVSPTNTYQAYNEFGGASLYPSDSPARASRLSFDRPYLENNGLGRFTIWEDEFVNWMKSENRPFDVVTDTDLEDPSLLGNYNVVVFVGHSEYWTSGARQNLEAYSRSGGHVAILGGNTMWWQIRLQDNARTMIGWKDPASDPADDALTTVHWWDDPIYNAENRIIGLSSRHGGYANRIGDTFEMLPLEQRTGFTVTDATSWVYAGSAVGNGFTFGRESAGLQVDGLLFNCDANGTILGPDGSDGTPRNFHILATTPASEGYGVVGYYVNASGGAVFNAGSQNWIYGLPYDPVVTVMTRNVLNRFSSGAPLPYDPVTTTVLTQDTFNCAHDPQPPVVIGWRGITGEAKVSGRCAYEGRAGLDLSGTGKILLARSFTDTDEPRNHVETRMYLNLAGFVSRWRFPTPLLTLQYRQHSKAAVVQVAYVEADVVNGQKAIRLARRDSAGMFIASDWTVVGNDWHEVEMSWRSPGQIVLKVDEFVKATLENPDATQVASEIVIDFPAAETGDGGYACIDAIAAGSEPLGRVPGR
jgi:hypothetical protein